MKLVRVTSYATVPFRGVVTCGVSDWPTTMQAGTGPDGVLVTFGPVYGDFRECDLRVDLAAGASVEVDLDKLSPVVPPTPTLGPDLAFWGRPVLETIGTDGVVLHRVPLNPVGGDARGLRVRAHFAGRVTAMLWHDLWVDLDPVSRLGRWESLLTCANPTVGSPTFTAPYTYRLSWEAPDHVTLHQAGPKPAILMRAGDLIAQGQTRCCYGSIGWTGSDLGSYLVLAQSSVWAADLTLRSPTGQKRPQMGNSFAPIPWANRLFARTLGLLDGSYEVDYEIGWVPQSGSTGSVEDMGYAKGGESVVEPGAVAPRYHTALRWGARPCHWLEADGSLLRRDQHPQLVLYAGQPHWHPGVSPDRLGLERLPSGLDTHGWSGPDASHSSANSLWYAAAATCSPLLHRLVEHRAQNLLFSETLDPAWSTTSPGESRALYWSCLTYLNCLRLLRDEALKRRLLTHLLQRIEQVYLPWYQDTGGILYTYPTSDRRGGISLEYPEWMSCWQQAGGAFGLYLIATCREVRNARPDLADRLLAVARQAAFYSVDRGITDATADVPGATPGGFVVWDTIAVRADRQPLTAAEMVEGRGAHYSGFFREAWVPLAVWTAAREGHDRARRIYGAMYAGAVNGAKDLAWMPELTWSD